MSNRNIRPTVKILDAVDSDGVGTPINVKDYRHIMLIFSTDNSANMTVKFQASLSDTAPTFSSSASTSNHWDYVAVYDLEDSSKIDGDTGIALSGSDDVRNLMVNVDGVKWINAEVSSRSAGDVTLLVVATNNA